MPESVSQAEHHDVQRPVWIIGSSILPGSGGGLITECDLRTVRLVTVCRPERHGQVDGRWSLATRQEEAGTVTGRWPGRSG